MDFADIFDGPAAIRAVPQQLWNGLGMSGNNRSSRSPAIRDRNYDRKSFEAAGDGDEEQAELIRRQRMTNGIECV